MSDAAPWPATWSLARARPRVLFAPGDLPALRRRARTTHRAEYASLLALAERVARGTPSPRAANGAALRLALLALISGDRRHAALAARCLARSLALDVDGGYGGGSWRLQTLACCYDWLHASLPRRLRDAVARRAVAQAQALYDSGEITPWSFIAGHAVNQVPYVLMAGLAIGDDLGRPRERVVRPLPLGEGPRHAADYVGDALWRVERMFASWRPFLSEGCFPQSYAYTLAYVQEIPYLLRLFESGLGRPGFAAHPWFAGTVDWFTYALRDDETFIRFGDYFCREGIRESGSLYRAMAAIASRLRHPLARWWADRFTVRDAELDAFLFHDREGVAPRGPEALPRTRLFAPMGIAVARGGFDRGTVAAFKCTPVYLHNHCHRDQNSIVVYHRGELAIDSGAYDGYESPHWKNYAIRTIAHNTLVVHDPDEAMVMRGWPLANDGGQRFVNTPGFTPLTHEDLERDCWRDGRIAGWRAGDGFSYVCGDASRCYRPQKLTRFLRHVVSVLDWPRTGDVSLIVLDEVDLARDGLTPRILLHTVDRPRVAGGRVVARQGGGRLTMSVLAPAAARLATIGGPGKEHLVDGRDVPVDPHGSEELHRHHRWHRPGSWRVEVSPRRGGRRARFLTVWNTTDADLPPEPPARARRVAGGWVVTQGGLTVGLFERGRRPRLAGERVVAVELAR